MDKFKLLTGADIHEAYRRARQSIIDWDLLSPASQKDYEVMAAFLNERLSICESCGQRAEKLYEVAGNMLCGPCITPPARGKYATQPLQG